MDVWSQTWWYVELDGGCGCLVPDLARRLFSHCIESHNELGSTVEPQCTLGGDAVGLSTVHGSACQRCHQ